MNNDLAKAKQMLKTGSYTCALVCENEFITSTKRGVLPLLELYESGCDFSKFSAADKVIGNGAAWLYTMLKIKNIYAPVISEQAKATLERYGVSLCYDLLVPAIQNHAKNGFCPVETAVKGCTTQEQAIAAIKTQLQKMGILSAN